MDRELADKLHAELGYRSAGLRELSMREWASLRDDTDAFAKTPAEFERLIGRLRGKAYRQKVPASVRRERAKQNRPALEARRAKKAQQLAAKARVERHARWLAQKTNAVWVAAHNAKQQARRDTAKAVRIKATVYECSVCGVKWCPIRRLRSLPALNRALCSRACLAADHRARERRRNHLGLRKRYRDLAERQKERIRKQDAAKRAARKVTKVTKRREDVRACARCGARWCSTPWRRLGAVSKWCGANCQKLSAPSAQAAARGKRDKKWRERNRDVINAKARDTRRRR